MFNLFFLDLSFYCQRVTKVPFSRSTFVFSQTGSHGMYEILRNPNKQHTECAEVAKCENLNFSRIVNIYSKNFKIRISSLSLPGR